MDRPLRVPRRPLRIGLTGGIGSGKSTVARMLVQLGATLVDADAIARASTATGGAAISAIRHTFGDALINPEGALDRDQMRALAFRDPTVRERLEAIVHPIVRDEMEHQCQMAASDCVVLDIPLLLETRRDTRSLDAILVVSAPAAVQEARVLRRPGMTPARLAAIRARQMPDAEKRRRATHVIRTGLSRFHTVAQLRRLLAR